MKIKHSNSFVFETDGVCTYRAALEIPMRSNHEPFNPNTFLSETKYGWKVIKSIADEIEYFKSFNGFTIICLSKDEKCIGQITSKSEYPICPRCIWNGKGINMILEKSFRQVVFQSTPQETTRKFTYPQCPECEYCRGDLIHN